ncbi:hypothetical protein BYT27DRAFT_6443815 [Phlegmacium glaucopus]|nr:hypothetical protein BYT27DRAFT_6443815 [Phlegmacium glaucopus]
MFNTTLRYLNLIILPHPSFDVPLSGADPVFRIHESTGDNDTSYISENQISQFGPIGFSTPRKPVLNSPHERRRNTICCYSCHCLADPVNVRRSSSLTPFLTRVLIIGRRHPNAACKHISQLFLV